MGIGTTAKTLQKLADRAESLYKKMSEVREELEHLQRSVEATTTRVARLERSNREERALLEAIAEEHDIDVEQVLTDAAIEEAEPVEGDEDDKD